MKKLFITALLGLALPLAADQTNYGAGSQAAPWLKLSNNARMSALGNAGVAVADDVNAAGLNPAGLAAIKGQQVAFMHQVYVLDESMEHVAYGISAMKDLGLSLSLDYLNFGSIDKYKVVGNQMVSDGSFTPNAMHLDLGAGYALGSVALGVNAKYITQSFDGSGASTVGADLGARWSQGPTGLSLGLAVQDLGGQLSGSNLPLGTRAGLAYTLGLRQSDALTAAFDADIPSADTGASAFGGGVEYSAQKLYAVRAGYKAVGNNGASGLTFGAGAQISFLQIDYAYSAVGELGNTHQISALAKF